MSMGKRVLKERALAAPIQELCFDRHKIALVSGPRRCGKTTPAKTMMRRRAVASYENRDTVAFQRRWSSNPASVVPKPAGDNVPLLVLDEIHKHYRWKRHLKGVYDTLESPCDILVEGKARNRFPRRPRRDSVAAC